MSSNPHEPAPNSSEPRPIHPQLLDETSGFDGVLQLEATTDANSTVPNPSPRTPQRKSERIVKGYRLAELLGQGGMGRVFRAEDSSGRSVALKLLSPDLASSPDALARFKQEGLIASQINHPHCVFVHRVDDDAGTPFIAMELMTGRTLKDLVAERGPLPGTEAIRLILQCIEGLIEAHSLGMIHRDIKPANCYLDDEGNVKIGDFGLARSLVSDSELTQTGAFLGTPLFASPEQLLGQSVDTRSDIYSLSATLYYLLAGKAPFESPNAAQVIARIASSDPPSFESAGVEVQQELERIVMKGLARDASKRYETFQQMRDDLLRIVAPRPQVASIRRRFAAWIADYFIVTTLVSVVLMGTFKAATLANKPWWIQGVSGILILLYYFLSEAIFSTSIGKAAMRITVCDAQSHRRIAVSQAFRRSVGYLAISTGLHVLVSWLFPNLPTTTESVLSLILIGVQWAVLYSTWIPTNRRQLFHDWLSSTECRTDFGTRAQLTSTLELPNWTLPLAKLPHGDLRIPATLGRFQVLGEIETIEELSGRWWLSAIDPQLQRNVWIACFSDKSIEYEEQQQCRPKTRRLRYVDEGMEHAYRWFAYVAPEGVSLHECIQEGIHFPWPITRTILTSVAKESAELCDRVELSEGLNSPADREESPSSHSSAASFWSTQRWWVDAFGRISWVDFAYRSPTAPEQSQSPCTSWMGLTRVITLLGLPARHRLRKGLASSSTKQLSPPPDVEELPPLRAARLLESIARNRGDIAPHALLETLEKTDQGPHRVTGRTRFITSAASLGLMTPLMFAGILILAMPAIILCAQQSRHIRKLKTLQAIVEQPAQFADAWKLASPGAQEEWTTEEAKSRVDEELEQQQSKFAKMLNQVGSLERFILNSATVTGHSLADPPLLGPVTPETTGAETSQENGVATANESEHTSTMRTNLVIGDVSVSNNEVSHEPWTEKLVDSILQSAQPTATEPLEEDTFPDAIVVLIGGIACILWTTFTLGGICQYFTGSCVVRRDGCRLNLWRSLLRASLLLLPVIGLGLLAAYGNSQGTDWIWITTQWKRAFIILPFIYLASTIRWSHRTLLDMVAGTAAVPR